MQPFPVYALTVIRIQETNPYKLKIYRLCIANSCSKRRIHSKSALLAAVGLWRMIGHGVGGTFLGHLQIIPVFTGNDFTTVSGHSLNACTIHS